jgi:uncharacterized protein YbcI
VSSRPVPTPGVDEVRLAHGRLRSAIARAVVQVHSRRLGRGPTKARAFFRGNVVVLLLYDAMTKGERSLAAYGRVEAALELRRELEQTMREDLVRAVEGLTDGRVLAFMSDSHLNPDLVVELYMLDRPVVAPVEPAGHA